MTELRCEPFKQLSERKPKSLLSGWDEALEVLEPVLDEDHLRHGLRLPVVELHHQEALAIGRDIPGADWVATRVLWSLEKQAGLAQSQG